MNQFKPSRAYAALLLALVVGAGIFYSHRDLAAWLLLGLSFVIPAVDPRVRDHPDLLYAIWFTLVAHHLVALTYAYAPGYLPVVVDADTAHRTALRWASSGKEKIGLGQSLYEPLLAYAYRLGGLYRLGGESLLLAKQLSIIAYTLSCLVFVRFFELLDIRRFRAALILLFGLAPGLLLYTSIAMREAWIIALLMGTLYLGIRFAQSGARRMFVGLLICVCALGVSHKGMMFLAGFLFLFFLGVRMWRVGAGAKMYVATGVALMMLMAGAVYVVARNDAPGSGLVRAMLAGRTLSFIGGSRELIDDARSTFDVSLDATSYTGLLLSMGPVYVRYLFGPFPWQASDPKDIYAMLEALGRLLLLGFALHAWRRATGAERHRLGILLLIYLAVTLYWTLGTTNYGQALRHHVTSTWILLLTGAPNLLKILTRHKKPGSEPSF